MRHLLALFVLLALADASAVGQNLRKMGVGLDKRTFDHGVVEFWHNPPAFYRLTNTGSEPIDILPIFSQEDLEIIYPSDPILPGQSSDITVYYYTANTGSFARDFEIFISRSAQPIRLTVKGSIRSLSPDAFVQCPTSKPQHSSGRQDIEAQVIDAGTQQPISGAAVRIVGLQNRFKEDGFADGSGIVRDRVDQGNYALRVEAPGYRLHESTFYVGPRTLRFRVPLDAVPEADATAPIADVGDVREQESWSEGPSPETDGVDRPDEQPVEADAVVATTITYGPRDADPTPRPVESRVIQMTPTRDATPGRDDGHEWAFGDEPGASASARPVDASAPAAPDRAEPEPVSEPVRDQSSDDEDRAEPDPTPGPDERITTGPPAAERRPIRDDPDEEVTDDRRPVRAAESVPSRRTDPVTADRDVDRETTPPDPAPAPVVERRRSDVDDLGHRDRYGIDLEPRRLTTSRPVTIKVRDEVGDRVPGAIVTLLDEDGATIATGVTSAFGGAGVNVPLDQAVYRVEKRGFAPTYDTLTTPPVGTTVTLVLRRPESSLDAPQADARPVEPAAPSASSDGQEDELRDLEDRYARLEAELEALRAERTGESSDEAADEPAEDGLVQVEPVERPAETRRDPGRTVEDAPPIDRPDDAPAPAPEGDRDDEVAEDAPDRGSYWDLGVDAPEDRTGFTDPAVRPEEDEVVASAPGTPADEPIDAPLSYERYNANNIVFLIDVSSSMRDDGKMDLLKESMRQLVGVLRDIDRVAVIAYNQHPTVVLESVSSAEKDVITSAIDTLTPGGLTYGVKGIQKAYEIAQRHFIPGGNNQIILATDGLFSSYNAEWSERDLNKLVRQRAGDDGIALSVIGFGEDRAAGRMMGKLANNGDGEYLRIQNVVDARMALIADIKAKSRKD